MILYHTVNENATGKILSVFLYYAGNGAFSTDKTIDKLYME